MTEEELNTNQTAEETEEDEDEEFKVVMPEPNRVTMDAEEFKEQPDYLKVFANFYIAKFGEDDLEIMNLYDEDNNMVDINKYALNNSHFTRKNLVKHALQYHDHNFKGILDKIAEKEDLDPENMKSYEDWDKWYEKRRSEVSGSLS